MNDEFLRRTWAEIDLDAAAHNYHEIRKRLKPETRLCCVVKADGYGHGAAQLSKLYERLGAAWLAVSNIEEAAQLREAGVHLPVLVLGYTPANKAPQLCRLNAAQAVLSERYAQALSRFAVNAGLTVRIHVKIDTGMSRIGFMYQDPARDAASLDEMERACGLPNLLNEGVFTHFAVSDEGEAGDGFTHAQYAVFSAAVEELARRGVYFKLRHCANSGAILDYPEMQMDMVRAGIILYGLHPSEHTRAPMELRPVMQMKTVVSLVKSVHAPATVSYGRDYHVEKSIVSATVPVGYADGYPRALSNRGDMLLRGVRAHVLGRVCMDQLMLDVTGIPNVREDDVVTVFGRDGEAMVSVEELAALCGTISYELVCLVSKRVPRVYLRNGAPVPSPDYICGGLQYNKYKNDKNIQKT